MSSIYRHISTSQILKIAIALILIVLVGFISFGLFTRPNIEDVDSQSFSAVRVSKDLEIISKEHHSIEHPVERAKVRAYLSGRLLNMGGSPTIFYYDSIKSRFGDYYDIGNIYCKFDPKDKYAKSYVLLVAHMDSRFRQVVLKDTVYSYGAADDGYGLGVSLEVLNCALMYQNEWNQGIKILFTDSEENDLDGMKSALKSNPELFDNVGVVINIEARGVKGPALLFETSSNNSKLLKLYKEAKYPYTYSLTSVVYNILPNFTDFSPLKDSVPGYNFSVIDNLNYYHTDKDNFDNINLSSIQHYGSQIEPMIKSFLTDEKYSDPSYFKGESDDIFFTMPLLGLFSFSKPQYLLLNSVVFSLLCLVFAFTLIKRGITVKGVLRNSLFILLFSIVLLLFGELVAYLSALIVGTKFDIVSTKYIKYDYLINLLCLVIPIVLYVIYLVKNSRKSPLFMKEHFIGGMVVMMIFSIVLFISIGENFFFLIPVLVAAIALIFNLFTKYDYLSLPAILIIELLQLSFLYNLLTALTIGSIGIVLFITFYNVVLISGLSDCYLKRKLL